jgi:serine/threonine protein kinase
MTDLADVYTEDRNFDKAKELYKEACDIYERRRDGRIKEVKAKLYLGEQVGRYRLVKFLGLGGFANVYLGEHTDSKGLVKGRAAIKLLQDTDPETAETFSKEAGILLSLGHKHIVRGLEFGKTEDEVPFLVMEYVPDGTLRDAHSGGERVPLEQVVDYMVQIASALQYMHGRKYMHLDIKPANILRVKGQDGQITLLLSDFGLARVAHSTASRSSMERRGGGTIPYMEPELLLGGRASNKSDQRALAVMVCEWLSGKRDQELGDIIYTLGSDKCPPGYPPELGYIPEEIRRVIFRGMARCPKDRFPSVGAFAGAFVEACAEHGGVPIEEHLSPPMMDELRKHVEMEAAQERVDVLDDKMRQLQQENDDLKRNLEGNERITRNLRERVGELGRQGQVYQQGKSGQLAQENRALKGEIDELNRKMQHIEEEKKILEVKIEENRKFYDDNVGHMYNVMVDYCGNVIRENQELDGRNQNLIDQRKQDLQEKRKLEKTFQEIVQSLEQQSFPVSAKLETDYQVYRKW